MASIHKTGAMLAISVTLGLLAAPAAHAENLLSNPRFKIPAPGVPVGSSTTLTGQSVGGLSAAADWYVWNNTSATTTTQLVPSTPPGGESCMLHVMTTGPLNGLYQLFLPWSIPALSTDPLYPAHTLSAVWVYVVQGQVYMGTGFNGDVRADAVSSTTGRWELLQAPNGVSPVNESIIYSASAGAEFYVYKPWVHEVSVGGGVEHDGQNERDGDD